VDDSTLVVSGLSSTPVEIAVDATGIYWIGSDQTVGTSDKTGAGVATFAQSPYAPQHITIDASYIYWSNNLGGAVVRLPKQAGAPATFAAATEPTSIAIASDGTVYWVEQGTTIRFAAEGGGAPTVLATSSNDIGEIAVDDWYVYAATATPSSAPVFSSQVERFARPGGAPSVLVSCPCTGPSCSGPPGHVRVGNDGVYYVCTEAGAAFGMAVAYFRPSSGACTILLGGADYASNEGLVPDPSGWVYIAEVKNNYGVLPGNTVYKTPNFGSGEANLLTLTESPFAIDDAYFYYVSGSTIRRRPK
jgi:hypothetical protein